MKDRGGEGVIEGLENGDGSYSEETLLLGSGQNRVEGVGDKSMWKLSQLNNTYTYIYIYNFKYQKK